MDAVQRVDEEHPFLLRAAERFADGAELRDHVRHLRADYLIIARERSCCGVCVTCGEGGAQFGWFYREGPAAGLRRDIRDPPAVIVPQPRRQGVRRVVALVDVATADPPRPRPGQAPPESRGSARNDPAIDGDPAHPVRQAWPARAITIQPRFARSRRAQPSAGDGSGVSGRQRP